MSCGTLGPLTGRPHDSTSDLGVAEGDIAGKLGASMKVTSFVYFMSIYLMK
jgi:hypothetical protein